MCTIDWPATFDCLKDVALGGAAIVTAWVAVQGLRKWSEELRGKAAFEVARGVARATYKVRDELAACRAPLIRSSEYPPNYSAFASGQRANLADEVNKLAYVYNNRWTPVMAALREFDTQKLEAEALWGADIRLEAEALHRCANVVYVAIESILDNEKSGGNHFEADREFGRCTRSQAHASRMATDNPLSNEIAAAVLAIETKLGVHLKRPGV